MTGQYNHDLKLNRAIQHLERLKGEVKRWLGEHPYFLVSKFDPQRGEHSVWIRPEGEPPAEIGLIVGDCLHNLRSALDSLVYDLGRVWKGGELPPDVAKKSEFPIYIDPDEFRKFRKRKIGAISPHAQADIEGLQPYNEWGHFRSYMALLGMRSHPEAHHPLWLLQELSNIDKHRERHLTLFGPEQVLFGGQGVDFELPTARDATSIKGPQKF